MNELRIVIPGNPPTVNHVYRNVAINRRITTADGQKWRQNVQAIASRAIATQGWKMSSEEKLVGEVMIYWPTRRKRDVENVGKLLWDALEGIVYENDRWLLPRYMDFSVDKHNPRVEIKFYRLEETADVHCL
ncbi:RusA family crossover junction endodeoxyribonuclease [Brevibacillus ruminantium]|uniref:RusA family crossover junction endodeoxyribonuclease n=1 Tax=Brevibacillus ruminantium TaxID=2950604 RepID=A0ABY4WIL9_9BACL|nr:RusA family crossover junction endodeoxyribonuclease [Brevibacillus ruminantium]USG65194.1 RusA family crossover junction endodeoxyribonuclease [Brevibacillus ruminantium]